MPNKLPKFFDDTVTGSSNFGKFIKLFESDDSGWIEEINIKLEEQGIIRICQRPYFSDTLFS